MNDLVPTNDYHIWYDDVCRGTRINHGINEYFIPDRIIVDIDSLIERNPTTLEQFKL